MNGRRDFLRLFACGLLGLAVGGPSLLAKAATGDTRRTHRVARRETLGIIAARYGVTVAALKTANGLKSDRIRAGQILVLPIASVLASVISVTGMLKIEPKRWRYVVAHHSGIEAGNAKSYGAAHKRRGMENGLAYDFVIGNGNDSGDGEIEIGPRWIKQIDGGHVRSEFFNAHGIGVCLVGNFEKRGPSAAQMASFTALVDWLRSDAPLGTKPAFTVHRWVDKNHTVCPGRYFPYEAMKQRYA